MTSLIPETLQTSLWVLGEPAVLRCVVKEDSRDPGGLLALPSVLVLHISPKGPHIAEDLWGQAEVRVELLEVFLGACDVVRA